MKKQLPKMSEEIAILKKQLKRLRQLKLKVHKELAIAKKEAIQARHAYQGLKAILERTRVELYKLRNNK